LYSRIRTTCFERSFLLCALFTYLLFCRLAQT
jgi:hypothetical protein